MSEYTYHIHDDTGELYIDLGENHPGYVRYIWFSGDMEVYTKEDFGVADRITRTSNSHEELVQAVKSYLTVTPPYTCWPSKRGPREALEKALAKAEGSS